MPLQAEEFIRRFLLHVLPEGFQRIRYYGFLANRYREQKLTRCRDLLGMPAPQPAASEASTDYHDRYEELTGFSLWKCPVCHQGRMLMIEILPRSPPRHVTPIKRIGELIAERERIHVEMEQLRSRSTTIDQPEQLLKAISSRDGNTETRARV